MKLFIRIVIGFVVVIVFLVAGVYLLAGSPGGSSEEEIFTVPENAIDVEVVSSLHEQKFIRDPRMFQFLLNLNPVNLIQGIQPGGYQLRKNMTAWEVVAKVTQDPDLLWASFSSCQRKEQIGEKLAAKFHWSNEDLNRWNSIYADSQSEYFEGVYYPDTYLIPVDEPVEQVAQRFINRFNEKIEPLLGQFAAKNVKWSTGVKIASLIERETDEPSDMKLISGIIWNRLNQDMLLQIDSTMQYTRGKGINGNWWGGIDLEERLNESPYNTYLHKGLPPTPICSPGMVAIEAAINPEETQCIFYLHGRDKKMHCSQTYEEHLENIEKYLN
jgi:UPF0755 protein